MPSERTPIKQFRTLHPSGCTISMSGKGLGSRRSVGGNVSRINRRRTAVESAELCQVTCDASVPPDVRHLA